MLTRGAPVRRPRGRADEGSITVLVIGYVAIVAVLLTVGIDVSKVFLARRALSGAADAAALAAAQGVDRAAVYDGTGLGCGARLPLDAGRAQDLALQAVADQQPDLGDNLRSLQPPQTSVTGPTATVRLTADVGVPFGHVLDWLDPSTGGQVGITATSHADSPVVTAAGC